MNNVHSYNFAKVGIINIDVIFEQLKNIFMKEFKIPLKKIQKKSNLSDDLGFCSRMFIEFLCAVEEQFDFVLSLDDESYYNEQVDTVGNAILFVYYMQFKHKYTKAITI